MIDLLQKEKLKLGHAKVLAAASADRERVIRIAQEAADGELSVRELEKLVKSKTYKPVSEKNNFYDERYESVREKLEKKTGYHFNIKSKKNGSGQIVLKFNNEAEFNDLFDYLYRNQ